MTDAVIQNAVAERAGLFEEIVVLHERIDGIEAFLQTYREFGGDVPDLEASSWAITVRRFWPRAKQIAHEPVPEDAPEIPPSEEMSQSSASDDAPERDIAASEPDDPDVSCETAPDAVDPIGYQLGPVGTTVEPAGKIPGEAPPIPAKPKPGLTNAQALLAWLREYGAKSGVLPSKTAMASGGGMPLGSVTRALKSLEAAGEIKIERTATGRNAGIKITDGGVHLMKGGGEPMPWRKEARGVFVGQSPFARPEPDLKDHGGVVADAIAWLHKKGREVAAAGPAQFLLDGDDVTIRQLVAAANDGRARANLPLFVIPDIDLPSAGGNSGLSNAVEVGLP